MLVTKNGEYLISSSRDKSIIIWNMNDYSIKKKL